MFRAFYIPFFFVFISGFAQAQYKHFEIQDKDTVNIIDMNDMKQGIWREFWPNGDLKQEISYKDNKKDGLEITWYDHPDCVEQEAFYKDGKLDGSVTHYSKRCRKDFFENYKNGVKHGYNKQSIREPIASWFYDKTYNISYQQHAVTRNRTLVAMSLGYATPTNAPDYGIEKHGISAKSDTSASRMAIGLQGVNLQDINLQGIDLQGINIKRDYIIALHGTSRASKLWPIENWVNLGKELAKQNISLALPWANDVEFARANAIAQQLQTAQVSNCIVSNCIVLPKLSIAQIASVISNAKAAIGVDTGLSHLAAALNIPTIAIYTDTNPALTGVLGGAFKPAINLGNIAEIPSVSDVLSTLKQIL